MVIQPNKEFSYEVINSRMIQITSLENTIIPYMAPKIEWGKDIIALEIGDIFMQLEDEFDMSEISVLKHNYKINHINCLDKNNYILLTHLRNRATLYLLPILDGNKDLFLVDDYMINAYISENLNYLNLLYRFNTNISYKKLELELIKHKNFISLSDENKSFVMFKFKINDEFQEDVDYFLEGKYSLFSEKLKKRIQFFNKFDKKQRIIQTIFKDSELKNTWEKELNVRLTEDIELDSIPIKSEEIWNNNLIR